MRVLAALLIFFVSSVQAVEIERVRENLIGNYQYLVQSQVKCDGDFEKGNYICNKDIPGERRVLGTWDSYIIPLVGPMKNTMRWVDSNVFVTAHTVFPLFSLKFEDPELEKSRLDSIHSAMSAVNLFRRKNGFAFWPRVGVYNEGDVDRVGALNLSLPVLAGQMGILDKMQGLFHTKLLPKNKQWMIENLDLNNRDFGLLFNIPNDVDDTSLGVISNHYYYQDKEDKGQLSKYVAMVDQFAGYTDTYENRKNRRYKKSTPGCNEMVEDAKDRGDDSIFRNEEFLKKCSLDDPREAWRYSAYENKHSGAVMTWLYDENKGFYENPEEGLAFTGQNSIDCNVMANVTNAMSLTGKRNDPKLRRGYVNTCNAIANTILNEDGDLKVEISPRKIDSGLMPTWRICGLFYPAHMTFPYLLTKAINEADACQDLNQKDQERFDRAIEVLAEDILKEQSEESENKSSGTWYEKIDNTTGLPTALGAASLVNIYKAYGDKISVDKDELESAIDSAVDYILDNSDRKMINGKETISLEEGTFFGGGTIDEIAHWRSRPFATAVSLELMSKYYSVFGNGKMVDHNLVIKSDTELSTVVDIYETRSLPENYKQDSLYMYEKSSFDSTITAGLKLGKNNEAIIGVELSYGEIYKGNAQDRNEKIAFYKIKVSSEFGIDVMRGNFESYKLDAKFLGVSTKTDSFINSEFAYLPISYVKQGDLEKASAHLFTVGGEIPIVNIGDNAYLNVDATAKVLGYINRSMDGDRTNQLQSYDIADVEIGISYVRDRFSIRASYEMDLGYSEDGYGNGMSSHNNNTFRVEAKYQISNNQSLSFGVEHHQDNRFDENAAYMKYEYKFN